MEKLFNARWWDYHNRKFNINGRICLETLIPFGIAGTVLLKWVNPIILGWLEMIPSSVLKWILGALILLITIDTIISTIVISNFKKTTKEVENEVVKDDTEEITNMVKEVTTQKAEEIKESVTQMADDFKNTVTQKAGDIRETVTQKAGGIKNSVTQKATSAMKRASSAKKNLGNIPSSIITTTKEYTDLVKERFAKTWLNRRFLRAFPNLQARSTKILRLNEKNEKNEK